MVFCLSILQHKLVSCLTRSTFTDNVSVGLVTGDKANWLRADLTAFTVIQKILMFSATINCNLILSQ